MRRRMVNCERVCRCEAGVPLVRMNAQTLNEMIAQYRRDMTRQDNVRTLAHRALHLGDLCEKSGYLMKAIEVWREAMRLVVDKDFDDLIYVNINHRFYNFDALTSSYEARQLGERIDRVWRKLGLEEMAGYARKANRDYRYLWEDIYDESMP